MPLKALTIIGHITILVHDIQYTIKYRLSCSSYEMIACNTSLRRPIIRGLYLDGNNRLIITTLIDHACNIFVCNSGCVYQYKIHFKKRQMFGHKDVTSNRKIVCLLWCNVAFKQLRSYGGACL